MKTGLALFSSPEVGINWMRFQLLENGQTQVDVAKIMKVKRQRIQQLCVAHNIDISQRTARWYAKRWGIPELEDATWLMEQKREGKIGIGELAERLGVSYPTFRKQIVRLGLDPKDFHREPREPITLRCFVCEKLITRPSYRVKGRRHVFCSRSCRSSWLGKKYGFGSQKRRLFHIYISQFHRKQEPIKRLRKLAEEKDCSANSLAVEAILQYLEYEEKKEKARAE